MLRAFGAAVSRDESGVIALQPGSTLHGCSIDVPADISSAAFFLVAASIIPGSELVLEHVGVNPTRTGVIEILRLMGADIREENPREVGGEPVADLRVRAAELHGIDIPEALVPLAIDEFPVLFIAAAAARGATRLTGARELRVKESDRIQVMADGLNTLGVVAEPAEDGITITGGPLGGGRVASHGDHRIAMAFAVAGAVAGAPVTITDCDNIETSFPDFAAAARSAGLAVREAQAGEY
jgi:3-phosphoshikimate 1-carboxyvinyltransferase